MNKLFLSSLSLLFLLNSNAVLSAQCVIDRSSSTPAPLTWNNFDRTTDVIGSVFNEETCSVPTGSYIDNIVISVSYSSNPNNPILTKLPWAEYGLSLQANGVVDYGVAAIVSGNAPVDITSRYNVSAFNGFDLHDLDFAVFSRVTATSVGVRCANNTPSVCEAFMYATYKITIDYTPPVAQNYTELLNRQNGLCLDAQGYGGASRRNVMLYPCDGFEDQLWLLPNIGEWGEIKNKAQNLCLDVKGYTGVSRDNVMLYQCDGFEDQQWQHLSDGRIINKQNRLCLDVQGYNGESRDNVILYQCDGFVDQEWDK